MIVRESTLEKAHLCNGGFNEHTTPHPKRDKFFKLIDGGKTIEQVVDVCLKKSVTDTILNKLKNRLLRVKHLIMG